MLSDEDRKLMQQLRDALTWTVTSKGHPMTPDQLIDVLQGVKVGRKWQYPAGGPDNLMVIPTDQAMSHLLCRANSEYVISLVPIPDEIEFNGVMIPAPLRVVAPDALTLYVADPLSSDYESATPYGMHERHLERGLLHLTPEAAAKHGRAMCITGEG